MRVRTGALIVAIAGVTLLITVTTTELFSRTQAFERLSDDVRPTFSDEALADQRADVAALEAFATDLPSALSLLGGQAGLDESQLAAFIARFPSVEAGLAALPQLAEQLGASADTLTAQQANFRSADAIPTSGLATQNVARFLVAMGILAIVAAAVLLTVRRRGVLAAVVIGVIIIVVPLATSLPSKSSDSDALNAAVRPVFTAENVAQLRAAADALEGFGAAVQTQLLPAVADLLGTTPSAVTEGIGQFVPTVGAALERAPGAISRLRTNADIVEANIEDFRVVDGTSYEPIAWITLGMGALVLIGAAVGMGATGGSAAGAHRAPRRLRRAA